MKGELTRHHVLFPRRTHTTASPAHKELRQMNGLIIPMPPELHNDGSPDSLHQNVWGVATVTPILARRVLELVEGEVEPETYLRNIDLLAGAFEQASMRGFTIDEKEVALMAADSVLRQRSYVAHAVGNNAGVFSIGG